MPGVRVRVAGLLMLAAVAGWLGLVAGCGAGGVRLVPVVGKVTVDAKPLNTGTVSFRPDKAKGNTEPHEPAANIEADGTYKLYTAYKEGAPTGWYKVAVVAAEPGAYPPKKLFVNEKYIDFNTSGLSVQVVEHPD